MWEKSKKNRENGASKSYFILTGHCSWLQNPTVHSSLSLSMVCRRDIDGATPVTSSRITSVAQRILKLGLHSCLTTIPIPSPDSDNPSMEVVTNFTGRSGLMSFWFTDSQTSWAIWRVYGLQHRTNTTLRLGPRRSQVCFQHLSTASQRNLKTTQREGHRVHTGRIARQYQNEHAARIIPQPRCVVRQAGRGDPLPFRRNGLTLNLA